MRDEVTAAFDTIKLALVERSKAALAAADYVTAENATAVLRDLERARVRAELLLSDGGEAEERRAEG